MARVTTRHDHTHAGGPGRRRVDKKRVEKGPGVTRRPTVRPTRHDARPTTRARRRDETRRDETRRRSDDDGTTRPATIGSSRRFDSIQIRCRFDANSIRFVTARPTATDADDGPPPSRARAGDESTSSTIQAPNRGRRIESNRIERSRVDVSLASGRGDATTRCDGKGRPRVPSALLEAVRFSPAEARANTSNRIRVPQRRARGGCAHSSAEVKRARALALDCRS